MRRARSSGRRTRRCRGPCRATGPRSRAPPTPATRSRRRSRRAGAAADDGEQPARLRGRGGAADLPGFPHQERGVGGGGDGARGLGGAALDGELGAAGGRDGLHGRGARPGDPDAAREQRDGADAGSEGDAGPVCGGRGDAHGRGAGAGAACGRGGGAGPGAGQPEDQPGDFERVVGHPPSRLVEPRPSAGAQEPEREHRDRVAREPGRGGGAVPGAGGAVQYRSDPGRAAADGAAGGQLRAPVRRGSRSMRWRRRR